MIWGKKHFFVLSSIKFKANSYRFTGFFGLLIGRSGAIPILWNLVVSIGNK